MSEWRGGTCSLSLEGIAKLGQQLFHLSWGVDNWTLSSLENPSISERGKRRGKIGEENMFILHSLI